MRKWLLPLAVVVLATLAFAFGQLWVKERARADTLRAALESRRPQDTRSPAAFSPTASSRPPIERATVAPATDAARDESFTSDESRLLEDPTYRMAYRNHRLAELTRGHVDITRVLGISRETADRLLAYLVDREIDWLSVPRRNPQTAQEQEARRLENERREREEDVDIGAIVGAARVATWHDYQDSLGQRHEVLAVGRSLALAGAPLRDDQVDALVAAMASERQRTRDELARFGAGLGPAEGREAKVQGYINARQAELDRAGEERLRATATRILTPEQLSAFVDLRRQWKARQDAEVAFFRAANEARQRLRQDR